MVTNRIFSAIPELPLEPEALARVPRAFALASDVLLTACDGNHLTVALPDTADSETIDRLRFETGMNVHAVAAPRAYPRTARARLWPVAGSAGH